MGRGTQAQRKDKDDTLRGGGLQDKFWAMRWLEQVWKRTGNYRGYRSCEKQEGD